MRINDEANLIVSWLLQIHSTKIGIESVVKTRLTPLTDNYWR